MLTNAHAHAQLPAPTPTLKPVLMLVAAHQCEPALGLALLELALEPGELLLRHRADAHAGDADGLTPLHRAARGGHIRMCAGSYSVSTYFCYPIKYVALIPQNT